MSEFSSRMLYSAQLLGHHPLDPIQEFGFIPYAEEALESLKEAIEEEFGSMTDDFKSQLEQGMKSFSSHVMQIVHTTLDKLQSAALGNMCIPVGIALPEDRVDSQWLGCTDADQRTIEEKVSEAPERLKALRWMNETLKQKLVELESAQSFVISRLRTVQAMKDTLRQQGVISPTESTSYNIQKLEELGDKLKSLLDPPT